MGCPVLPDNAGRLTWPRQFHVAVRRNTPASRLVSLDLALAIRLGKRCSVSQINTS